ncbi:MAG: prolyl oligopeptidase family serine peptidase [Alphaproteobacteria bacterium]|jgi:phospholipase/carboxylesterase|nr:prolyl oligopeptidase family serine peptidase [Alphaproteobacteria bacterium]
MNINKLCILLHGYGSDDKDLESLIPVFKDRLREDLADGIDFISVAAPNPCEQGVGLQWFSLGSFWETVPYGKPMEISQTSIDEMEVSKEYLDNIINNELEKRNLTKSDLILVGFSQGASLAIDYTLTSSENDAPYKCISFSGFALPPSIENRVNMQTPLLMCHGEIDDVVPLELFEKACEMLDDAGIKFDYITSPTTGHWISEDGMDRAVKFIEE